ncbi:MAG: SURF1 family protein [Rhodobacter sp.]|nr:SURF1 family protein [Rhodobacter sp.]
MTRRMILPLLFGLFGTAILIGLCVWQVQRLAWKQAMLAEIEARISAAPVALPEAPDPVHDRYLPVSATGVLTGERLLVLASVRQTGAVYRVISVLETNGRRVLVDRGTIPVQDGGPASATGAVSVIGNLHWPEETDRFTPAQDPGTGLLFARDVPEMAALLTSEPVLIVARAVSPADPGVTPLPVGTEGIPNDHLTYAITWFLLALVWAGMTAFLLWRIRARTA